MFIETGPWLACCCFLPVPSVNCLPLSARHHFACVERIFQHLRYTSDHVTLFRTQLGKLPCHRKVYHPCRTDLLSGCDKQIIRPVAGEPGDDSPKSKLENLRNKQLKTSWNHHDNLAAIETMRVHTMIVAIIISSGMIAIITPLMKNSTAL